MELEWSKIILITLISGYAQYDGLHTLTGLIKPVTIGFVIGIILGDYKTGLMVGAIIQLMSLGVGNFGGASIVDYFSATIIATTLAITSNQKPELAVSLAIPFGVLFVNFDILARFSNLYFQKKSDKMLEKNKYSKIVLYNRLGIIFWSLSRMIPIFISLVVGPIIVNKIIELLPQNILNSLQSAGSILPAVGLAILLRYMPLKQNVAYLIIGFWLSVYLKLSIIAITLIGISISILVYKNEMNKDKYIVSKSNVIMEDE